MSNVIKIYSTSVKKNKYFEESTVEMGNMPSSWENSIINVFDKVKYQTILGFGGAFTESAAYNYSLMSEENKEKVIKAYFDKKDGIGYSFGRTHINSCDFSLSPYTYVKDGDKSLKDFDISRDKKYIIPFIKDAQKYTGKDLVLFASPWSPPAYMKDNNYFFKGGKLLDEFKPVWARYYAKYIKAMRKEGIKISAITIQNEPNARQTWESCFYTAEDEAEFIRDYLVPALDKEKLSDIKIIIWDHNKERVFDRAAKILKNKAINKRVWAVGHHWYSGHHYDGVRLVTEVLKKPSICTEFCGGNNENPYVLGERYGVDICENLNSHMIASCDWNLILDEIGGPFHNRGTEKPTAALDPVMGCSAPIMYNKEKDEVIFNPSFYYIAHFSKFVKRDAVRIATSKFADFIHTSAFINPNGEKVVVVINTSNKVRDIVLRDNDICTKITIKPNSVITAVY